MNGDAFGCQADLPLKLGTGRFFSLQKLDVGSSAERLPFSIKILLEQALRNLDGFQVTEDDIRTLAAWAPDGDFNKEIPFKPARVILQDFTGVPSLVDLAALRSAMKELDGDPSVINPRDRFSSGDASDRTNSRTSISALAV